MTGTGLALAYSARCYERARVAVLCARWRSLCTIRGGRRDAVQHGLRQWPDAAVAVVRGEFSELLVLEFAITWKRARCRALPDDAEGAQAVNRNAPLHRRGRGVDLP